MFSIPITGLKDGAHEVAFSIASTDLETGFGELNSDIVLEGVLKKNGNKFTFSGRAVTMGSFVCDLSLEPYDEEVAAKIEFSAIQDSAKLRESKEEGMAEGLIYVSDDAREIEVSGLVAQELILALPMKRIAPKHRGKDLADVYPQLSEDKDPGDDNTWDILKNIKIN